MAIYFLTEQRLKDFTIILGNVDIKLINPLIPSAADLFIKPRTGSHFFNHLLKSFNDQTLTTYEEELVSLIQQSLMWRVADDISITTSSQVTNKGPQEQFGMNSSPSSLSKIGFVSKHYTAKADFYDNRIIHYIWSNKNNLPEFTNKLNKDCDVDLYPSKTNPYNGGIYFF